MKSASRRCLYQQQKFSRDEASPSLALRASLWFQHCITDCPNEFFREVGTSTYLLLGGHPGSLGHGTRRAWGSHFCPMGSAENAGSREMRVSPTRATWLAFAGPSCHDPGKANVPHSMPLQITSGCPQCQIRQSQECFCVLAFSCLPSSTQAPGLI